MAALLTELNQQPAALRAFTRYYQQNPHLLDLSGEAYHLPWVLTGMGASYHAAAVGALHLNAQGIEAEAVEAVDLVHYSTAQRMGPRILIYFSQSGSSGEVERLLSIIDSRVRLVAVTNEPGSPLAQGAQIVLPLIGGEEQWVAGKTYVNSLALAWLLARRAGGSTPRDLFGALDQLAAQMDDALQPTTQVVEQLSATFENCAPLVFAGHGPHALTARAAAMVLSEWPKVSTLHFGIGAFRHGFIEAAGPAAGAVIFSAPGPTQASALELAAELHEYGVRVLRVEQGRLLEPNETPRPSPVVDEFLCPLLDILPFQLYADALAQARGITGFRYISKIVRQM
jgi:glutamine---fructose-6-phosphate transaminase (isomerizing)